jgi:hypothetical protein
MSKDRRLDALNARVTELEQALQACLKLMKIQSEAMISLTGEVVRLSNTMNEIFAESERIAKKTKKEEYFH